MHTLKTKLLILLAVITLPISAATLILNEPLVQGEYTLVPIVTDTDGDGIPDTADTCPDTPLGTPVDVVGCPLLPDADGDGVSDSADTCPDTPVDTTVDTNGCPLDSDGDGVIDDVDDCPHEFAQTANGCPLPAGDSDNDGVPDTIDECPNTPDPYPDGTEVDAVGCPLGQVSDVDGDDVADTEDFCNDTPTGSEVDLDNGCSLWPEERIAHTDKTLQDCIAEIEATGDRWCEMSVDLTPIWPDPADQQFEQQRGRSHAVWWAFNGASFNGNNWCFHGGGHASYGGNDTYCMDIAAGTVTRVWDSTTFTKYVESVSKPGEYALRADPEVGPESTHTYDGLIEDPENPGLTLLVTGFGFTEHFEVMEQPPLAELVERGIGIYAFNRTNQPIKGIPPKTWKRLSDWDGDAGYPYIAYRDGCYYMPIANKRKLVCGQWEGDDFVVSDTPVITGLPGGNQPTLDTFSDGTIWYVSRHSVARILPGSTDVETLWKDTANPHHNYSLAEYGDGFISWDGARRIAQFSQVSGAWAWQYCDYPEMEGREVRPLFSRWQKVPGHDDIYIGWSDPRESGPMIHKHVPAACGFVAQPSALEPDPAPEPTPEPDPTPETEPAPEPEPTPVAYTPAVKAGPYTDGYCEYEIDPSWHVARYQGGDFGEFVKTAFGAGAPGVVLELPASQDIGECQRAYPSKKTWPQNLVIKGLRDDGNNLPRFYCRSERRDGYVASSDVLSTAIPMRGALLTVIDGIEIDGFKSALNASETPRVIVREVYIHHAFGDAIAWGNSNENRQVELCGVEVSHSGQGNTKHNIYAHRSLGPTKTKLVIVDGYWHSADGSSVIKSIADENIIKNNKIYGYALTDPSFAKRTASMLIDLAACAQNVIAGNDIRYDRSINNGKYAIALRNRPRVVQGCDQPEYGSDQFNDPAYWATTKDEFVTRIDGNRIDAGPDPKHVVAITSWGTWPTDTGDFFKTGIAKPPVDVEGKLIWRERHRVEVGPDNEFIGFEPENILVSQAAKHCNTANDWCWETPSIVPEDYYGERVDGRLIDYSYFIEQVM